MSMIKIDFYTTSTGKQPFADWQDKRDATIDSIIDARLVRVRLGNFGDCTRIKGSKDIWELRIDFGPGYRIYYAKENLNLIILLVAGIKKDQTKDITKAERYWLDHKEQKNAKKKIR